MNGDVLNSWKEIAAYMGRGVRTVQRWEQELGLPVRRPRGKERSAVIALKPDLDRWLRETPQGTADVPAAGRQPHTSPHVRTERLLKLTQELVERSARMQEAVKTTLALTSQLRNQQAERMRSRSAPAELTRTFELRIVGGGDV
jgi:phage terminase Nu1 subunit (DNA packaging protein)